MPAAEVRLLVPGIVPAGQYKLELENRGAAMGTAKLIIGRNARPVRTWNLQSDFRGGAVVVDLPVNVGSLVVAGDSTAMAAGRALSLRPVVVVPPRKRLTNAYARRVERYGAGLAYFLDDEAFVEEPGFWVRGAGRTQFAVAPAEPNQPRQLSVRNAPVRNTVDVDIDGTKRTLDLQPGEERTLPMTFDAQRSAALINIYSRAGFRPSETDAKSTDTRFLGVWVELR